MSNYTYVDFRHGSNNSWNKVYNYIKPNSKILDIGCSSGTIGKILIDNKDCVVDGIEVDKGDFEKARKKLRNVYQFNIEEDRIRKISEEYDYVYFGDVIEHLVDPINTLKKIKKLLKPKGEVVFSIPNMAHMSVRLMLLKGDFKYGETGLLDKTHMHFYTFGEIQRIFNEAGYEIKHLDPVIKSYDKKSAEEELSGAGLKPTREFFEIARKSEASIFQYVGSARPTSKPKLWKLDSISPNIDQLLEGKIEILEGQIKTIIKEKDKHIRNISAQNEKTKKEIEQIKKSNSYKLAKKLAKIKNLGK